MKRLRFSVLALALALTSLGFPATAGATAVSVALDIQGQGLNMVNGGVGLVGLGTSTRTVSVNIGGPIQGALLYWAGRDRPCPQSSGNCIVPFQPYKDQTLNFDGTIITGTIIGTEQQPATADGPVNNIGFLADVTSLVQAKGTGLQTFGISDGDTGSNLWRLEGAGLIVIYTDTADTATYRVILNDGLDFAWGDDLTAGASRETTEVAFNHGSITGDRTGQLTMFTGGGTAAGADRVEISNNSSRVNEQDATDGASWDTDTYVVDVASGIGTTLTKVFSDGTSPDQLLWAVAAFRVSLDADAPDPDMGCGPGFWKNHLDAWAGTGYLSTQTLESVFDIPNSFGLDNRTLVQGLQGGGGKGLKGGATILLRAAVAALLNAADADVNYPRTAAEVIADVNAALASSRADMLSLATALDVDNNLGCPA